MKTISHGPCQNVIGCGDGGGLSELPPSTPNIDVVPATMPALIVAAFEAGQDVVLNYGAADGVGECSFEAVADLDANFVLLGRDDKQHAVVYAFLPDAPMAA